MSAEENLKRIADSYDRTLEEGSRGVNLYDQLPETIISHASYAHLRRDGNCLSGNPDIREFLAPRPEDRFLDLGCCVNIINHRLHEWPSGYYGVDISSRNIACLERYVREKGMDVGGLHCGPADRVPFQDGSFRIAACVGVLEYHPLEYAANVVREGARVLEGQGRFYVDIPNVAHPGFEAMCLVEEHMRRPILLRCPPEEFERLLEGLFQVLRVDASRVMTGYFLRRA